MQPQVCSKYTGMQPLVCCKYTGMQPLVCCKYTGMQPLVGSKYSGMLANSDKIQLSLEQILKWLVRYFFCATEKAITCSISCCKSKEYIILPNYAWRRKFSCPIVCAWGPLFYFSVKSFSKVFQSFLFSIQSSIFFMTAFSL